MKLIIIHSFGTNSIILDGFRSSLDRFFDTEIIDLPGFHPQVPPVTGNIIEEMTAYVSKQLESQQENFLLAGISFGFGIVARLNLQDFSNCKGVLAIEPFIGADSLLLPGFAKQQVASLLGFIDKHDWEKLLVNPIVVSLALHAPLPLIRSRIGDFDRETFTRVLKFILTDNADYYLNPDLKYCLLVNPREDQLNYEKITSFFERPNARLIEIDVEHYPKELTKEYFDKKISAEQVTKVSEFLGLGL